MYTYEIYMSTHKLIYEIGKIEDKFEFIQYIDPSTNMVIFSEYQLK